MSTLAELVQLSYRNRLCFICGRCGICHHREFNVEAALIEVELRKYPERKPVVREERPATREKTEGVI